MMTISWMMTISDLAGDFLNYEEMLIESDNENLIIKEKPLLSSDGRIKGNKIAIRHTIKTQAILCPRRRTRTLLYHFWKHLRPDGRIE